MDPMGASNVKPYRFDTDDAQYLEHVRDLWYKIVNQKPIDVNQSQNVLTLVLQCKSQMVYQAFAQVLKENAPKMHLNDYTNVSEALVDIGYYANKHRKCTLSSLTKLAINNRQFCLTN